MPNVTYSPNMNLPVPVVSTDFGPDWANNLNSCLAAIDSHDHTPGYGTPITPSAIDINADLSMAGNSLTSTESVAFQAIASLATLDALYVVGVDLYFNDGSGNNIRITQSGSVAGASGTITGLPSGTASASYQSGSGTFQFQSATNTPANITGATVYIAEQTTSPNIIGLKSPTSLAGSYDLTMPAALPGSTKIVQLDSSGNFSATLAVDNSTIQNSANTLSVKNSGITATQIATDAVTTAKIQDAAVTPAKLSAANYQSSSESGTFNTTSSTYVDVTNLSCTITTNGRPVLILVSSNNSTAGAAILEADPGVTSNSINATFRILRDATQAFESTLVSSYNATSGSWAVKIPMCVSILDVPAAGTYTYKVQLKTSVAARMEHCVLSVIEL
jgi:hypothetical protein